MNRRLALSIGLGALLAGRIASAQEVTIGYQGLPYKATGENNTGIQIADGVLLHAGIGVEAGYDTNVFYAPTNAIGSSIFRVMPYLELTNATRTGPASKELTFDARAGLQYRHYGNSEVSSSLRGRLESQRRCLARARRRAVRVRRRGRVRPHRGRALARHRAPQRRRPNGRPHPAHQQPGLDRRSMVTRRRPPHGNAALHQHGEHLRQQRSRNLQLRERDDQHVDAGRRVEVAPQDRHLRQPLAGRTSTTSTRTPRATTSSPIRIPSMRRPGFGVCSPRRPRPY